MNAALAKLQGSELSDIEAMIQKEMQQDQGAYELQPERIKIAPGGVGLFQLGQDTQKEFMGIVAISQIIRGYWPGSGTGEPPLCQSPDGSRGVFSEPSDQQMMDALTAGHPHPAITLVEAGETPPQFFNCATCPLNQWGSEHQRRGGQGRGKACKEMRRLLLLVDGWALPAIMSLPPTSIKAWDAYCSALASRRSAYFAQHTVFQLDSAKAVGGETYNTVRVMSAGQIDGKDQLVAVAELRRQYRDLVSEMPVEIDEYLSPEDLGAGQVPPEDDIPF